MTQKPLIVVLGAGASHGCAPDSSLTPPVTEGLFSYPRLLEEYPLVQDVAPAIERAMLEAETRSGGLESYLKQRLYADDVSRPAVDTSLQIPLYLQRVLFSQGRKAFDVDEHYRTLMVETTERLDYVLFVTLNYDVVLDRMLFRRVPPYAEYPKSMKTYINSGGNFGLVKLHGSVNWGREILPQFESAVNPRTPALGEKAFARELVRWAHESDLTNVTRGQIRPLPVPEEDEVMRIRGRDEKWWYPALSLPLGVADKLNCPDSHVEFLAEALSTWEPLNLLVIGYGGADRSFLNLLNEHARGKMIAMLTVVDKDEEVANQTLLKILERVGGPSMRTSAEGCTFGDFVTYHSERDEHRLQISKFNRFLLEITGR